MLVFYAIVLILIVVDSILEVNLQLKYEKRLKNIEEELKKLQTKVSLLTIKQKEEGSESEEMEDLKWNMLRQLL